MQKQYRPTIGLEVHIELNTKSKMFCGCTNDPHDTEPNTHVCPICLAHPGTLPVPNEEAIKKVLTFGVAIDATLADFSEFDRKNYFYPDIPKAYQISQYAYPLLMGGSLHGVALTRVHLEEDTARSQHDKGTGSIVDFNRAGVPLMELVTEPVIHDAATAAAFAKELQLFLRTLQISSAHMERGEMRVEANVSVSCDNTLGTKVEVKNINSFKSVESAIEYEITRQSEIIKGGGVVHQETRGWDEVKQKTVVQRSKETAKDYRYFPDPDIPKFVISKYASFSKDRLADNIPDLPNKKREIYQNIGITRQQTDTIINNAMIDALFSAAIMEFGTESAASRIAANVLVTDVLPELTICDNKTLRSDHFTELIRLLASNKINSRVAKDLIPRLFGSERGPEEIALESNLFQDSDSSRLDELVQAIIAENGEVVAEYRAGKKTSLQYLIGQAMKRSRGAANPVLLVDIFTKNLQFSED